MADTYTYNYNTEILVNLYMSICHYVLCNYW